MNINIGISKENQKAIADKLNKVLADEFVLYVKTRNYHWNVESINFSELHDFYQEQYESLAEEIDAVAERVRKIGHYSMGRLEDYLKVTSLEEQKTTTDPKEQLTNLLNDHESIIRDLREFIPDLEDKYNDVGSADFITGLLQVHEEIAWKLRSHLK